MHILFLLCLILLVPTAALCENKNANRQDYIYGTGNSTGGYTNTYRDPKTGDIITRVVPPKDKNQSYEQNTPIYIYPQVTPNWPPQPGAHVGPHPTPQPSVQPGPQPSVQLRPQPRVQLGPQLAPQPGLHVRTQPTGDLVQHNPYLDKR